MILEYIQLITLFLVLFDPLASLSVFVSTTREKTINEQRKIALYAVLVAGTISFSVLFFGNNLLEMFNTSIEDFKIAGGIILIILGVNMTLGKSIAAENKNLTDSSSPAIAAIIGTPILAGPASITTIIITTHEYGIIVTGSVIAIVLIFTGILLTFSNLIHKYLGDTFIKVLSATLGLITLSWGVKFIRAIFPIAVVT